MPDELLTTDDLSGETKIEKRTFDQWRYLGRGPRFLKIGGHVRYRRADVDAWLAECERGVPDAVA